MISLQADPVAELEPIGGPWVGVLVPLVVLLASIAVSFFLFWHFGHRQRPGS